MEFDDEYENYIPGDENSDIIPDFSIFIRDDENSTNSTNSTDSDIEITEDIPNLVIEFTGQSEFLQTSETRDGVSVNITNFVQFLDIFQNIRTPADLVRVASELAQQEREFLQAVVRPEQFENKKCENLFVTINKQKYCKTLKKFGECSICSDTYKDSTIVSVLECGHIFHPDCITEWGHYNPSCPMCKKDIDFMFKIE